MSKMATFTPRSRRAFTVAAPRPDAPPVTTAETELSSFMSLPPGSCPALCALFRRRPVRERFAGRKGAKLVPLRKDGLPDQPGVPESAARPIGFEARSCLLRSPAQAAFGLKHSLSIAALFDSSGSVLWRIL